MPKIVIDVTMRITVEEDSPLPKIQEEPQVEEPQPKKPIKKGDKPRDKQTRVEVRKAKDPDDSSTYLALPFGPRRRKRSLESIQKEADDLVGNYQVTVHKGEYSPIVKIIKKTRVIRAYLDPSAPGKKKKLWEKMGLKRYFIVRTLKEVSPDEAAAVLSEIEANYPPPSPKFQRVKYLDIDIKPKKLRDLF
jgi:hypothetical protein